MVVKELLDEIGQIRRIAETWTEGASVAPIERDLVLGKLKDIYEKILFSPVSSAVAEPVAEQAAAPVAAEEEPAVAVTETESQMHETAGVTEIVVEQSVAEEAVPQTGPAAEFIPEPAETAIPADQKLFSDEPLVQTTLDKKQVILSLYGDDSPIVERKETSVHAVSYKTAQTVHPAENVHPVPGSEPVTGSKKVLGEVISNGSNVAFNEVLGKQNNHTDVASKIQHAQSVADLRQCIGINDKFLLIRDLFGGDSSLYDGAIAALNAFEDLDEALIYIQENYGGNPDSEGLRLLVDLLERKLGY